MPGATLPSHARSASGTYAGITGIPFTFTSDVIWGAPYYILRTKFPPRPHGGTARVKQSCTQDNVRDLQ